MKLIATLLLVLVTRISLFAQQYSSIIRDEEIHHLIERLGKRNFDTALLEWKLEEVYLADSIWRKIESSTTTKALAKRGMYGAAPQLTSYLTLSDFEFIQQQIIALKATGWDREHVAVKEVNKSWNSREEYYAYSIPLFSLDRKFALIKTYYFCGSLCGWSGIEVFKQTQKDNWATVDCLLREVF